MTQIATACPRPPRRTARRRRTSAPAGPMPQMLLAIVDTWRSPPRMSARAAEALMGERAVALDDSEVEIVEELPSREVAPELPGAETRIAALLARGWGTPARSLTRGLMATGMSYAAASDAVMSAVKSGRVAVCGGRMVAR